MFCFLAIGILLTFCIWKKFCTKSPTASDSPAPPAAAPYFPPAPAPMAQQHEQPPPSVQNPAPMQESAPTTFNFKSRLQNQLLS